MDPTFARTTRPVVACLDGGDDGDRALRFAIEEAQRRRTGIRLVHSSLEVIPFAPPNPLYVAPNLRDIGAHILKDALDRCLELAPDLFVEGGLLSGPMVLALIAESEKASCVVVGTRQWRAHRLFGGSTTLGLAARAHCPVIAVPPAWQPGGAQGRVIVGLDDTGGPGEVLQSALEAAEERGCGLTAVHAWAPPGSYQDALSWIADDVWSGATQERLAELTVEARADHPDVPVTFLATYDATTTAVPGLAQPGDLLVLGRHRSQPLLGHRLGSLARQAIHAGRCPVQIVPVPGGRTEEES